MPPNISNVRTGAPLRTGGHAADRRLHESRTTVHDGGGNPLVVVGTRARAGESGPDARPQAGASGGAGLTDAVSAGAPSAP